MKLVEVKNSLAKLYFQPSVETLVLSDFIKVDDNNKVLLAQVVSIESTSQEDTNCAILKFSLDINDDNSISSYSGYTPALNSNLEKINPEFLSSIFSSKEDTFCLGNISSSVDVQFNAEVSLLDKFLYIQSDSVEEKQSIFEKIAQFNLTNDRKTIIIDCDNLTDYHNVKVVELSKDFKLPISSSVLNYIYENDLNGLTLEQKTIVQDIILEIQDYIETLDTGYIPFDSLLDVVNNVYESDKSTGVILLRNKLLKYKQANLFASTNEEVISVIKALDSDKVVVLNLSKIDAKWQQEAINFVLDNVDEKLYLLANVNEQNMSKGLLGRFYKQANIVPVISSNYNYELSVDLKSFAKNLLMFKPIEQQKAFATYNSFLTKLAPNEFVISGISTFYTPLIIKDLCSVFAVTKQIIKENVQVENNVVQDDVVVNDEITPMTEAIETVEITLEDEIAKDVDDMFYAKSSELDEGIESQNADELLSEDDLSILDDLDADNLSLIEENDSIDNLISVDELDIIDVESTTIDNEIIADDIVSNNDNELGLLVDDSVDNDFVLSEQLDPVDDDLPGFSELDVVDDDDEVVESDIPLIQDDIVQESSLPIYSTQETEHVDTSTLKISEGNIVYHPRFGKGVVEELFSHGNRVMCSILFDQHGRRLLDPSIADLKQL